MTNRVVPSQLLKLTAAVCWAASTMDYSFLAIHITQCIIFSWKIDSAAVNWSLKYLSHESACSNSNNVKTSFLHN